MQRSKPIRKEIPARAYEVWEERQQLVLNMLDERLSYEEIADHFGISVHKIQSLGERALERRAQYKPGDADPPLAEP
jgi:DNA-directed RNA polymerase specialized sigma24 family protein